MEPVGRPEQPSAGEGDKDVVAESVVDVSRAIGEAGHEVTDLGFEAVADTGPVTDDATEPDCPSEAEIEADIASNWPAD